MAAICIGVGEVRPKWLQTKLWAEGAVKCYLTAKWGFLWGLFYSTAAKGGGGGGVPLGLSYCNATDNN